MTPGQGFRALALLAVVVVGALGAAFAAHAVGLIDLRDARVVVLMLAVVTVAAVLAQYLYLFRRLGLRAGALGFARLRWRLLHLLWQLPATVVAAIGVQALVLALTTGSPNRPPSSGDALSDLGQLPAPLVVVAFLTAAVVTPWWEEVLFRGAVLSGLAGKMGNLWAVLLTAAVFAAFHGLPLVMPYVFVLGLSLGLIRWFHRNLWASVAVHAANNALSLALVLSGSAAS